MIKKSILAYVMAVFHYQRTFHVEGANQSLPVSVSITCFVTISIILSHNTKFSYACCVTDYEERFFFFFSLLSVS